PWSLYSIVGAYSRHIRSSPKGKFAGAGKQVSEALGRKPFSTDLMERHPFDVEICRIPPGKAAYPYHTHSSQWEFYHIISGHGTADRQSTPLKYSHHIMST